MARRSPLGGDSMAHPARNGRPWRTMRAQVIASRMYCCVCHEPVDKTLSWPHPRSASVDHRIPVAHGGTSTLDNLDLAHLACNISKGAKTPRTTNLTLR